MGVLEHMQCLHSRGLSQEMVTDLDNTNLNDGRTQRDQD